MCVAFTMTEINRIDLANFWGVDITLINQLLQDVDLSFRYLSEEEFEAIMVTFLTHYTVI